MAAFRALTDFTVGTDNDEEEVPVVVHGGHTYDSNDKRLGPIIKRFADKFEPVK